MMDEPTIEEWMDRHHVEVVQTHATNLDGLAVGKHIKRHKFLAGLPAGHSISDIALAMDLAGSPHMTFWQAFREGTFGDILMRPDINTIVTNGIDPDLGHCICDFTDAHGNEISLCPRTMLRNLTNRIFDMGYQIKAAFELEFFIYSTSFSEAREQEYNALSPVTASTKPNIYLLRNSHHVKPFMDEVLKRLNWQKYPWESWSDEGGVGQVEINFSPRDPVTAADTIVRAKQVIYEVAVDLGMSVTFMASLKPGFGNGLHIHHSLQHPNGSAAFVSSSADGTSNRTTLMEEWIAGITETMPGATALLCPTYNAYRRLTDFTASPVTATWGEENKSVGLRTISRNEKVARVEHRLPSGDANPYLALATILAGGLAGHLHHLPLPEEQTRLGWGTPDGDLTKLPGSLMSATQALAKDQYLKEILGEEFVDYWINTRKLEWLAFHDESGDTEKTSATLWEFERYFELI